MEARKHPFKPPVAISVFIILFCSAYAWSESDFLDDIAVFSAVDDESLLATDDDEAVGRTWIEQSGARDLLDILAALPGFEVNRDIASTNAISLHGQRRDARFVLLIDGVRLQNSYDGSVFWRIPAEMIEQVIVRYDADGVLYGEGAFLCVIELTTRRKLGLDSEVAYGSTRQVLSSIAAGKTWQRLQGFVLAYADLGHNNIGALASSNDLLLSKTLNLHLFSNAQLLAESRGDVSTFLWKADLGLSMPDTGKYAVEFRVYGGQHDVYRQREVAPRGFVDENSDRSAPVVFAEGVLSEQSYTVFAAGARLLGQVQLVPSNILAMGIEMGMEGIPRGAFSFEANRTLTRAHQNMGPIAELTLNQNRVCNMYGYERNAFGACRFRASGFVQDTWQLDKYVQLVAGARLSSFSDVEFDFWSHLMSKVTIVVTPERGWNIKLQYDRSLSLATFEEQYDNTQIVFSDIARAVHVGNEFLGPELVSLYKIAGSYDGYYRSTRYRIGLSTYFEKATHIIDKTDDGKIISMLSNEGGYDTLGIETEGKVNFSDKNYIYFNVSWFRAFWRQFISGESSCGVYFFEPETAKNPCTMITDRPQLRLNLGVNVDAFSLGTLHLQAIVGSERRHNMRNALDRRRYSQTPAYGYVNVTFRSNPVFRYFVFDARLFGLPYSDGMSIYVGLNFLFDEM